LIAFSNAVDSFDSNRGNFLSFAKLLISERLIDFYRHQSRFSSEIKTDPYVFNGDVDEVSESLGYELSVVGKLVTDNENTLADEIDALNGCLAGYGISFYDLPGSSPKTKRTRESCRRIIFFLKENEALMDGIRKKGYLPIKEIEKNTKTYKKFIERYRNYIIAGVEILKGDYPGLQDYFLNQK
jgi:RNA polymerase sigma factor